jgi:hypothetical protein
VVSLWKHHRKQGGSKSRVAISEEFYNSPGRAATFFRQSLSDTGDTGTGKATAYLMQLPSRPPVPLLPEDLEYWLEQFGGQEKLEE